MNNKSEKECQRNNKVASKDQLIEKSCLIKMIKISDVPNSIEGKSDEERIENYAEVLAKKVRTSYPTQVITEIVEKDQLNIGISKEVKAFLSKNKNFDFATSCIHDYKKEIKEVAGENYDEVISELQKLQRVFQINSNAESAKVLLENGLHSAFDIANMPRKNFIKMYSNALGGEHIAMAIHLRASCINAKT